MFSSECRVMRSISRACTRTCCRGKKEEKLGVCAKLQSCDFTGTRGEIAYVAGVLHRWIEALQQGQAREAARKACGLCKWVVG